MLRIVVFATALLFGFGVRAEHAFPRLMGMNIGAKNYEVAGYQQDMAKLDVLILGFYRGWSNANRDMRSVVQTLKLSNPDLLVGQYTILNEANDDPTNVAMQDVRYKLNHENWWLRRADGSRAQWTSIYGAWDINYTEWSKTDFNGKRYPEWLAERDFGVFFNPVPEFDIWYFDNVFTKPRIRNADWDLDGRDDSSDDVRVGAAVRRGQVSEWSRARQLAPATLLMGNADNDLSAPEFRGRLQGVFLEGMMGKSWSPERRLGWQKMMESYHTVFNNLAPPKLVGFNVAGKPDDYRFFRYAFTSCLLDDGYFSFTDEKVGYSSVPWFDEYDFKLGKAISPPQTKPWRDAVYRRDFEHGVVLLNPAQTPAKVNVGRGFRHLKGSQAPLINTGQSANEVLIPPRDGLVLAREAKE